MRNNHAVPGPRGWNRYDVSSMSVWSMKMLYITDNKTVDNETDF